MNLASKADATYVPSPCYTDEGATTGPTGKRLEWKITPRDKVGPMALIGLGK